MKFTQAFRLAFKSMVTSKMRAFLTMLGIIIGVAAVIILISIVGGFSDSLEDSFESMGTNLITVSVTGRGGNVPLEPDDMFQFAEENRDLISCVSPNVTTTALIKYANTNLTSTVYGVSEDYIDIKSLEVEKGRFISYMDSYARNKVCVLGSYVANELFPGVSPLGNTVKVNGEAYTVVGVLTQKQGGTETSGDNMLILPYTAATRMSRNGIVSSYLLSARDKSQVLAAQDKVDEYMMSVFNDEDAYNAISAEEILDKINELTGMLTMILVGIAAISLLVAGIGIMNIMLVSVTERTREIGIRKALGGKRRDILLQFVIEAATTSAIGGVIGIIVGCVLANLAAKLIGLSASTSVPAIVVAFSVSVFIGIVFGYSPAAKASKLNPIDALRHD